MKSIEIKAPAKINIGLHILSKREDGYHNLETLFYPLSNLYDTLYITKSDSPVYTCSDKSLKTDSSNLIVKAVLLLEKVFNRKFPVTIRLEKRIPMGAGLGGGSSDAAAVIISLNDMFALGMSKQKMIDLALELGSDVPFFINARPAIGRSRGEILELIDFEVKSPILLVNPGIHISTKEAFSNITPYERNTDYKALAELSKDKLHILKDYLVNDFEMYVFEKHPAIASMKKMFYDCGALFALMSGTGSSVYGIFPDEISASEANQLIPDTYLKMIVNA